MRGPKSLCFSFSVIHLHVMSAATHNKCVEKMSMLHFSEEHNELVKSVHCLRLEFHRFITHVTETGMTPDKAKHKIPMCGNCSECGRVGMVFEPCPECNQAFEEPPWICAVPEWTTSHVVINPRLMSMACSHSTRPCRPQAHHNQQPLCRDMVPKENPDDPFNVALFAAVTPASMDDATREQVLERGDEHELPVERLVRHLCHQKWKKACRFCEDHCSNIGVKCDFKHIDFINNPVNPPCCQLPSRSVLDEQG